MSPSPIPLFKVFLPPREALAGPLLDTLYSGRITEGPKVVEFERRFGAMIGNPNILSFYCGTAALHAAGFFIGTALQKNLWINRAVGTAIGAVGLGLLLA